jgi:acyl-CoA reductase-like NAD-dependent aldehyde dehydrogenase
MSEMAKHWLDGGWTGSGTVSQSINPATGVVLGSWADGGEAEARAAIAARVRHLALVARPEPAEPGADRDG